ncbi:hypothetical protein PLESTB_001819400 [Pleodorina starrii]|uniref:Uncharacterized protein n=1 Tax=Pleodorina starrii TaxID=330485 RepID=A0A9W6FA21_9CHLO|nr:hypothetical protein PLESTB_001819400 [Pleodorina starrii]GLC76701.1 hypothetical protein PLESTF_001819900 [Pleodorina starrii]
MGGVSGVSDLAVMSLGTGRSVVNAKEAANGRGGKISWVAKGIVDILMDSQGEALDAAVHKLFNPVHKLQSFKWFEGR